MSAGLILFPEFDCFVLEMFRTVIDLDFIFQSYIDFSSELADLYDRLFVWNLNLILRTLNKIPSNQMTVVASAKDTKNEKILHVPDIAKRPNRYTDWHDLLYQFQLVSISSICA